MENNTLIPETLNGLVRINNDRIDGYLQAAKETTDDHLKNVFTDLHSQSVAMVDDLSKHIGNYGETPADGGTLIGNIHQGWLDFKATLFGQDKNAILGSCEFGDKAAIEAYDAALLVDDIAQNSEVSSMLRNQRTTLEKSLNLVKSLNSDN